jgi:hypothetical protein
MQNIIEDKTTRLTFGEVCGFNEGNNEVDGADDGAQEISSSKEMLEEVRPRKTPNNAAIDEIKMNIKRIITPKRLCFSTKAAVVLHHKMGIVFSSSTR